MYIYICIYVYMYIYIYICICICIYVYIYICMYKCGTLVHICKFLYVYGGHQLPPII